MAKEKNSNVETITLQPVPAEERKPWYNIAFIWAGSCVCVPALMVGGFISSGLTFGQSVLCMIVGYVLVVAYMLFLGMQSADLGLPSTVALSRAYGVKGSSILVSTIIAVSMLGWFAAQTALCANSFCAIMNDYLHIAFPYWASALIWGTLMFITAVYGVKFITILNKVSVPALFILLIWGVIASLMNGAAQIVADYQPPQYLGWAYGITMAVAGFASGAIISGDYTRYCKNRKETVMACTIGVLPAGCLTLIVGGFLSIAAGSYDLAVVFANFGLPIIGMLVLILATWTTNVGNAYSSGIAICNMFKLRDDLRAKVTLGVGAVGTLLAILGFADVFTQFLNYVAAFIPAVAGVAIADYWIMGKGRPELWKEHPGVNWLGIISWVAGFLTATFTTFFVPTLNGIIAGGIVYCILTSVIKNENINPIYKMQLDIANGIAQEEK